LEVTKRVPAEDGYVRIRIDGVDKRVDPRRLGQRLADSYRPLLLGETLRVTLTGRALAAPPIAVLEKHEFRVRAAGKLLAGWTAVLDAEHRTADLAPGMRCYKLGRLVSQGENFGHPSAAQVPGMAHLIGEVDLAPVPLTMNKSDFDRDSPEWVAVERRMHEVLAPLVRRLARMGATPPPVSALKAAVRVRRLLGQALRMLQSSTMFEGEAPGGRGRKSAVEAGGPLPLIEAVRHAERQPKAEPTPRQPPPAGKGSRRGFGDIVVRALNPTVRSQTVVEDGSTVIVINSSYPLFLVRGGDDYYQLETAVREICKAGESGSVAEYERRVNEILLTAMSLRSARRRKRAAAVKQLTFD